MVAPAESFGKSPFNAAGKQPNASIELLFKSEAIKQSARIAC
jgi:hypothetical protein